MNIQVLVAARNEKLTKKGLIFKGSAKKIQLNLNVVILYSVLRLNSDN